MKTILSLLLLPIMVLAQPFGQHQKESFDMEFSMNFAMESILKENSVFLELVDDTIELFVAVEVFVWEIDNVLPKFSHDGSIVNTLPQYLITYSLVELPLINTKNYKPQERLNRLLALNDPQFPKENRLLDGLNPVRQQQNKLGNSNNIPEGFGPRIRF
ncbi:MAG: hypothetical protein ACJART_002447 [Maribacter sp.]|jgi:hypothetical protein